MKITDISVPECYADKSADFRFFLRWFELCLTRFQYLQENFFDLYDPLRCPYWLLWMLADSMGYKYDDRLPASYCRLVLLNFMNMIRNRGSKEGVMLAAQVNLAQFNILKYGEENDILYNRLEDTSIPVNSVYVTPNTEAGFIDVVYYSTKVPTDACIEYVRPLGMYLFQHAGVDFQARTKITIDARLTDQRDSLGLSPNFGPTQVGHYTRYDYASLQKGSSFPYIVTALSSMKYWEKNSQSYKFDVEVEPDNKFGIVSKIDFGSIDISERAYIILDVEKNTTYTIQFHFKAENVRWSLWDTFLYVLPYNQTKLNQVNNIPRNYMWDEIGGKLGKSRALFNTSDYVDCSFNFASGNNNKVILVFDWGGINDYTEGTLYFTNIFATPHIESDLISRGTVTDNDDSHLRDRVWSRNSEYEVTKAPREDINPGYRSLYSLQLANNEHIVKSLIDPIFSLGYGPQEIGITYPDDYLKPEYVDRYTGGTVVKKPYNLRYDRDLEESITSDVYTVDDNRTSSIVAPRPAVNPIMSKVGDAISLNPDAKDPEKPNSKYIVTKEENEVDIHVEEIPDDE